MLTTLYYTNLLDKKFKCISATEQHCAVIKGLLTNEPQRIGLPSLTFHQILLSHHPPIHHQNQK